MYGVVSNIFRTSPVARQQMAAHGCTHNESSVRSYIVVFTSHIVKFVFLWLCVFVIMCAILACKSMLIVFFDTHSIVHWEFIPHGQTVTWVFCCNVLMDAVQQKQPDLWSAKNRILHDDKALLTCEFLAKNRIVFLLHPPNLAPADFISSPSGKYRSKVNILTPLPRAHNRWFSNHLKKMTSKPDSKIVRNSGIGVLLHNVNTHWR